MQSARHHAPASRWPAFKPVGVFVPKLIRETCRQRGFINVDIVLRWREIVGRALAQHTWPMRIAWPRRQEAILRPDGTEAPSTHRTRLMVGASPAKALDVEYAKRDIMDRVNAYLGYRAITELAASPDYTIAPADEGPSIDRSPCAPGATGDPLAQALARLGQAVARRHH